MSIVKAKRSVGAAAGLALFALATMHGSGQTAPSRSEIQHREQMMRSAAEAANQRTQRERETVNRQKELLQYQIRKNQRLQMKMQCRAAGGGTSC